MGYWTYCTYCSTGINKGDYTLEDIYAAEHTCGQCGHSNEIADITPLDVMQELVDLVTEQGEKILELETQIDRLNQYVDTSNYID